jgi:hypothetical protein
MTEAENVININGKDYTSDDLNDQQQYLIVQIRDCQAKASKARFEMEQAQAAQNAFTNLLIESVSGEEKEEA